MTIVANSSKVFHGQQAQVQVNAAKERLTKDTLAWIAQIKPGKTETVYVNGNVNLLPREPVLGRPDNYDTAILLDRKDLQDVVDEIAATLKKEGSTVEVTKQWEEGFGTNGKYPCSNVAIKVTRPPVMQRVF